MVRGNPLRKSVFCSSSYNSKEHINEEAVVVVRGGRCN
jgi:hypothetical protein